MRLLQDLRSHSNDSNFHTSLKPTKRIPLDSNTTCKTTTMTSLSTKLAKREADGNPIQVGIIGAGKFGSMFISQSHRTSGLRLAGIADLSRERALAALKRTGYPSDRIDASISIQKGIKAGKTAITTDSADLIATPGINVILEVTGNPAAGIKHALLVSISSIRRCFLPR
jgi:predicted homoserine dehydrogenase-like protein